MQLDLDRLLSQLEAQHGPQPGPFLSCPSPSRNHRPVRTGRPGGQLAKWRVTWEELPRSHYPDYCFGWLWVTTPGLGMGLAEVATYHAVEVMGMVTHDDSFVTGILRERLGVEVTGLVPGAWGALWDSAISHCPCLGIVRQNLFNDIVLRKGPASMPYVGGYTHFFCTTLEMWLMRLEALPFLAPALSPLWAACARASPGT